MPRIKVRQHTRRLPGQEQTTDVNDYTRDYQKKMDSFTLSMSKNDSMFSPEIVEDFKENVRWTCNSCGKKNEDMCDTKSINQVTCKSCDSNNTLDYRTNQYKE